MAVVVVGSCGVSTCLNIIAKVANFLTHCHAASPFLSYASLAISSFQFLPLPFLSSPISFVPLSFLPSIRSPFFYDKLLSFPPPFGSCSFLSLSVLSTSFLIRSLRTLIFPLTLSLYFPPIYFSVHSFLCLTFAPLSFLPFFPSSFPSLYSPSNFLYFHSLTFSPYIFPSLPFSFVSRVASSLNKKKS